MDILFIGIITFLFILAVFDLSVGVSNDAVNFLNSAIGAKVASFKRILIIASIGVFAGAVMSNGMMDIARHGIFHPEQFSFYEVTCIFMAVMVTDIILLDIFNTLAMPTSTTVSMVFELLGAAFAISLFKVYDGASALSIGQLINTEKALSVILGIFLSVGIAFFFGTIVQFLTRLWFSFNYTCKLKWKIGVFGGIAITAIIYFLLIKGMKDLTFMTPELKTLIKEETGMILLGCFVFFTLLMQALHWMKVNVFKVIVLLGTFSLAMAFAGNDLVNFIGVPLAGFSSFQDYMAHGAGDPNAFYMSSLNESAHTPFFFLLAAGIIMVVSLATSKKARRVSKTAVDLSSQTSGEEMFGSSRIARHLVRMALNMQYAWQEYAPQRVQRWIGRRFNTAEMVMEDGAAFDLVRASINLTLAGILIAIGTSMKLPLSTTFVTFMVAMGSSLADRAWGRESAVFRITGVISVIGGWFITAGMAFIGAALIVSLMSLGGFAVMLLLSAAAIIFLIRSNTRCRKDQAAENKDILFRTIIGTTDPNQTWQLLQTYIREQQSEFLRYSSDIYNKVAGGFMEDDIRKLHGVEPSLIKEKSFLKSCRRKQTLCLRRLNATLAIEKSTWFHLAENSCMSILYNLRRINEVCLEHVDNNFRPLPVVHREELREVMGRVVALLESSALVIEGHKGYDAQLVAQQCKEERRALSKICHAIFDTLHSERDDNLTVMYVYLNLLQETEELLSSLRKLLRATRKLREEA